MSSRAISREWLNALSSTPIGLFLQVEAVYQSMGVRFDPSMIDGHEKSHHGEGGDNFNPEIGEELEEDIEGDS